MLAYDGIRAIPSELTAQILIVLQTRYEKWVADRTTASSMNGAISSLSNLVAKLLPHAKEQLLVLHRQSDDRYSRSTSPAISVRATADFLGRIAHLSRLARDNGCAYVAADMSALEHAWSVNQISSPRAYSKAKTELCVSPNEVWIRAQLDNSWSRDQFETVRLPLREICPIDLVLLLSQKRKPRRVLSRIVSLQICRETGGFRYAIPAANAPPACRPDGGGLARSARRGKLRAGKQR